MPAEFQESFRLIRQHTTTPLAVGEIFNSIWDCKQLIEEQLIDYIRATVVHAGGITHLRRIAALADVYKVRTGCHGATDLSPVTMRRRCTSMCRSPISASRNICTTPPRPMRCSRTNIAIGTAHLHRRGAGPGGGDRRRAAAKKFPYKRAYLPVNRLEDGTMYNW